MLQFAGCFSFSFNYQILCFCEPIERMILLVYTFTENISNRIPAPRCITNLPDYTRIIIIVARRSDKGFAAM